MDYDVELWTSLRDEARQNVGRALPALVKGSDVRGDAVAGLRHFAYAAGWKKFEPLWDFVIRAKRAGAMLPVLETILSEFGRRANTRNAVRAESREQMAKERLPSAISHLP